jgi:hypothetical protein
MLSPKLATPALLALVTIGTPVAVGAQQLAAQISVPVAVTVRPTLAIRSVMPRPARVEPAHDLTSSTVVNVEANLPYRLAVRLAPLGGNGHGRVLVRSADGRFEPLVHGASVTTAVSRAGGERGHEVVCRVESSATESCTLVYELTAEHHDTLLRSSATDHGLRAP